MEIYIGTLGIKKMNPLKNTKQLKIQRIALFDYKVKKHMIGVSSSPTLVG